MLACMLTTAKKMSADVHNRKKKPSQRTAKW